MSAQEAVMIVAGVGAFFNIFRFAIDLIVSSSDRENEKESNDEKNRKSITSVGTGDGKNDNNGNTFLSSLKTSTHVFNGRLSTSKRPSIFSKMRSYRSANATTVTGTAKGEGTFENQLDQELEEEHERTTTETVLIYTSFLIQTSLFVYFLTMSILVAKKPQSISTAIQHANFNEIPLGATTIGIFFGLVTTIIDYDRKRFLMVQRIFFIFSSSITMLGSIFAIVLPNESSSPTYIDYITMSLLIVYTLLAFIESKVFQIVLKKGDENKKKHLGKSLLKILKPYFWPEATSSSAFLNRTRAILTWMCVAASKTCSLISPIFLGKASTALSRMEYSECARYAIIYCSIQFSSTFFKECQSLVYLKVAQAAFVQLSELSFSHLHSLSLDWHLKKKLGEVIRSMDRGILSCDTLMKYLFLWLIPALSECVLVCVIFAAYFDYLPLALAIFTFVFVYMVWTILVTLWRKKFRKSVAKSDNDWHDKCTDSLINYETVKFFTSEKYEIERFSDSVKEYQSSSVQVQASLGFLNITQMMLMQTCLASALVLATYGIQKRSDCCVDYGCDNGNSQCCTDLGGKCSGMEVGDFVTVLTYTLNLFMPLNFLGSVYNAIVMALVDLRNLSELLAEDPDLVDSPDAIELPPINESDPDVAVEFDNVVFRYPSQMDGQGLTGVSFQMKQGTTTAIVGTTGAGKTTISRLLFRFYDVNEGAVKVNGVDVRTLTQHSLRNAIGVVPQSTSMFNDTLRENVLYGQRDATQEQLDKVAESAQLLDFIRSLPEGWDTVVGDRGLKLSGGEKQRTAIARCLLKDPPFVVLDEATSALDTVTENSIQEALDALGSHRTCLVIAHRLGTIRNADNIVVLGNGGVLEQGTHEELLEGNGKYAEMWNMQLHTSNNDSSISLGGLVNE